MIRIVIHIIMRIFIRMGNDIRTRSYEGDPYGNDIRKRSYEAVGASSFEQLAVRTGSYECVRNRADSVRPDYQDDPPLPRNPRQRADTCS